MRSRLQNLLLIAALVFGGVACGHGDDRGPSTFPLGSVVARNYEVRLRKLHLVRPDLIPYPIYYEVYC